MQSLFFNFFQIALKWMCIVFIVVIHVKGKTAPLPNARHQVCVSRVLGGDHYKEMARVT